MIIGGGLAGAKAAEALRAQGYDGRLTLVGDETVLPYERPPMSKAYLAGTTGFDDAVVHPAAWYRDQDVELRLGSRAVSLDTDSNRVTLVGGERLDYDKLLLATGAVPRRLGIPGARAALYLRRREDADAIRATFGPGRRLAIIGAGWIGLEVAAAARAADTDVVMVEAAAVPLLGVLGPRLGAVFADLHRDHGVDLRLGASVEEIIVDGGGAVTGVRLAGEADVAADAIVVGIGVLPDVALAADGGLAVQNGVLVDAGLRTSEPDVYAVGDIANHHHPVLRTRVRVEHWATALNQPAVAAAGMRGVATRYENLPYFFSDQYDLGMEYVGHAPPGTAAQIVVRGDLATRMFAAFWLDSEQRLLAAMAVNTWDVIDAVKPLITSRRRVDPTRLADPDVAYAEQ